MVPTVTWPRVIFLGGGRMQHGGDGADSWVIQLGIQTLLSCNSSALTNLEVFQFVQLSEMV